MENAEHYGRWFNLSQPENSRALNAHLRKDTGWGGLTNIVNGKAPLVIQSVNDPTHVALRKAVEASKKSPKTRMRIDMLGVVHVPQKRDFGGLY